MADNLFTLTQRLAEVQKELASAQPALMREYELLQELIKLRRGDSSSRFAGITAMRDAVMLCIAEHGTWMTKQEVLDQLVAGGFRRAQSEKWSVNDALNYQVGKKRLVVLDPQQEGWDTIIGLPSWKRPIESIG